MEMSDNSISWTELLSEIPDTEEILSSLFNEKPADNLEEMAGSIADVINKTPKTQNNFDTNRTMNIIGDHPEIYNSSCLPNINIPDQALSTAQIRVKYHGCLINPCGFSYQPQFQNGLQNSQRLLIMAQPQDNGHNVDVVDSERVRKKIMEGSEEAKQRKRKSIISNRASAARSRAKKQEHIKLLEDEVEALKDENARMKKIILEEEEKEKTAKMLKLGN